MSTPSIDLSAGLVTEPDPLKTTVPMVSTPPADLDLSAGFVPVPPKPLQEDNYFKQVKDRVSAMGKSMYDAWEAGDFEAMTGVPAAVTALNKQYYETLWKSKSPSEFAVNLVPIFGPVLNHAASRWAAGEPQGSAAELTTDVLLPLLADKIPGALGEAIPSKWKTAVSAAGEETATNLMSSALKPPITGKPGQAAKIASALTTAKEEAIPASRGGLKTLVRGIQEMQDVVKRRVELSGAPRVSLELREGPLALPKSPVDFELGPSAPPPGTKQTVLSHPETVISETPLRAKPNMTQQPANPSRTGTLLDRAKDQQLLDTLNQQARDSGLLDAVQDAARAADQPVPYDASEVFNFRVKNAVDRDAVAARLDQLKKRFQTVNPEADFAAIDAAKEEFLRNYPRFMSNQEAHALKVRTGNILSDKAFGELKTAAKEAEKTLRRGLAEELEKNIPELKYLNAREGDMIGLRPILMRAIGRVRNWDVIGLGAPMAAAAGGIMGGAIGAEEAALVSISLRDPWVKSKLAIAINRAAKLNPAKFGTPSITAAEARVAALQAHMERAAAGINISAMMGEATKPNPVIRPQVPEGGWIYQEPESESEP